MPRQRNEFHQKQVFAWRKSRAGLAPHEAISLLMNAIHAIRKRSVATLSNVTVTAVIDRTLHEAKEIHPALSDVKVDSAGIHFQVFLNRANALTPDQAEAALQYFLIELLDVFGKITAEILTKYLYQELLTVTHEMEASQVQSTSPGAVALVKKNREQK
jgi:hypothetical protein